MLARKYKLADKLVFSKVKAAVGGRVRYFVSGGGPLEPALNRFFYSIGMTILEGYGLTETSPVTNVNTFEHFTIGTVGPPVPGTEIRIAPAAPFTALNVSALSPVPWSSPRRNSMNRSAP